MTRNPSTTTKKRAKKSRPEITPEAVSELEQSVHPQRSERADDVHAARKELEKLIRQSSELLARLMTSPHRDMNLITEQALAVNSQAWEVMAALNDALREAP